MKGSDTFDIEDVFGDDYLYFHGPIYDEDRSDAEIVLIEGILGLAPPARVLDVACGTGRISRRLAERGYDVVGVDVVGRYVELASAAVGVDPASRMRLTYMQGDMRDLQVSGEFDAVICWSTSFGYFDDEGNRAALREMTRVLREGGLLLIGHQNRDFVLRTYITMLEPRPDEPSPPRFVVERGDDLEIDRIEYEATTGRLVTHRIVVHDGRVSRREYVLRLFTFTELADWLGAEGLVDVRACGDGGAPFTLRSRKMYVSGVKARR